MPEPRDAAAPHNGTAPSNGPASRDVTEVLLGFARTLRHAGVPASPERVQAMLAAADALEVTAAAGVYWAGRLTLCAEPDDLPTYDAAFSAYFQDGTLRPRATAQQVQRRVAMPFGVDSAGTPEEGESSELSRASEVEVLRHRELLALSATERDEVRRLLALLAPAPRPAAAGGTVRPGAARWTRREPCGDAPHGGEPARLARRARRTTTAAGAAGRRLGLDGAVRGRAGAVRPCGGAPAADATEVFTVGTRLTRVTRALRHRDPDAALKACGRAIPDWSGGTRLGEALRAFLDRWGQRGSARQAVVVMFSDGWERGDPALLAEQMLRLSRFAYRLIWVNPHRGKGGYAPLAGGMAAALPHVDDFVAGHSFAALEELVTVIAHA